VSASRDGEQPLYRQVYEALRHRLDDGTYRPGQQLPTEPVLAAEMGVHRLTVRRAVEELSREGLLQARQGVGTFASPQAIPLAVTVPLTRAEFDSSVRAQLISDGRQYADRLLSTQVGADPDARRQLRAGRLRLRKVDSGLVVDGEMWICSTAWGPDRLLDGIASQWRETDGIYGFLLDRSVKLSHRWRSFSAEAASAADARTLGVKPGSPLLVREGLTADAVTGKAVLWIRRRARPDRVRYVLDYETPA
jgi:GntR family transcriptional regulator